MANFEADLNRKPGAYDPFLDFHLVDRSKLDAEINNFDRNIAETGVKILWYKSIDCPCEKEDGHAKYDCQFCFGIGRQHLEPQELIVVIQSRSFKTDHKAPGWVDIGSANVSWPSGSIPAPWDKIVEMQSESVNSEILTRGEVTPAGDSLEKVRSQQILRVEICIDYAGNRYLSDHHFKIFEKRFIRWNRDCGPLTGKKYAIRYVTRPEYIIMDAEPIFRIETDRKLPFRAIVKRYENMVLEQ